MSDKQHLTGRIDGTLVELGNSLFQRMGLTVHIEFSTPKHTRQQSGRTGHFGIQAPHLTPTGSGFTLQAASQIVPASVNLFLGHFLFPRLEVGYQRMAPCFFYGVLILHNFRFRSVIKTDRREKPNPIFEDFFVKNRKTLKASYKESSK